MKNHQKYTGPGISANSNHTRDSSHGTGILLDTVITSRQPRNLDSQNNYKQCSGSVCFGPVGSGSVIICTDPNPDPSINKQKI